MALDTTRYDQPYLLGRLMALWFIAEKKAGTKQMYILLGKTQMERPFEMLGRFNRSLSDHGEIYDQLGLDKVMDGICKYIKGIDLPNRVLTEVEQASWILGYYHQKQAIKSEQEKEIHE